jgi:hypothetical protein
MPAGTPGYWFTTEDIQNQPPNLTIHSVTVEVFAYPIEPDTAQRIYDSEFFVNLIFNYTQLADASGVPHSFQVGLTTDGAEGSSSTIINTQTIGCNFPYGSSMTTSWTSENLQYFGVLAPFGFKFAGGKAGLIVSFQTEGGEIVLTNSGNRSYTMLGQWIHNLTRSAPGDLSIPSQQLVDPWDNPVRMTIQPLYGPSNPFGDLFILNFAFKITNNTANPVTINTITLNFTINGTPIVGQPLINNYPIVISGNETSSLLLLYTDPLTVGDPNYTLNEISAINIDYT